MKWTNFQKHTANTESGRNKQLNRLIINNETDLVIKIRPVNKSAAPDCFTGNSTKHIKKG